MERQIELSWRCGACAAVNRGRDLTCVTCGKGHEDEPWLMPDDPSLVPSVTDSDLLALALQGPNWRCRYCGGDQRRNDGGCAQCGADKVADGAERAPAAWPANERRGALIAPPEHDHRRGLSLGNGLVLAVAVAVGLVALTLFALVLCGVALTRAPASTRTTPTPVVVTAAPGPTALIVEGTVREQRWRHEVVRLRSVLVEGEGFADQRPLDAVDVHPQGERQHHTERVQHGTTTERYTVEEPDGTRRIPYTEQERCGESCTERAPTCRQQCTSNRNGFATCKDVCSGGGRDCTPRYCSVTKYKEEPQTRTVTKTREVPRFVEEPRFAPWFRWRAPSWQREQAVVSEGTGADTRWPALPKAAVGRPTREERHGAYSVVLLDDRAVERTHTLSTLAELQRFAPGRAVKLTLTPERSALLDVEPLGAEPAPSASAATPMASATGTPLKPRSAGGPSRR